MPYNPGVSYHGSEYLAQGIQQGKQTALELIKWMMTDKAETDALREYATGMEPTRKDDFKLMNKSQLQGFVGGRKAKEDEDLLQLRKGLLSAETGKINQELTAGQNFRSALQQAGAPNAGAAGLMGLGAGDLSGSLASYQMGGGGLPVQPPIAMGMGGGAPLMSALGDPSMVAGLQALSSPRTALPAPQYLQLGLQAGVDPAKMANLADSLARIDALQQKAAGAGRDVGLVPFNYKQGEDIFNALISPVTGKVEPLPSAIQAQELARYRGMMEGKGLPGAAPAPDKPETMIDPVTGEKFYKDYRGGGKGHWQPLPVGRQSAAPKKAKGVADLAGGGAGATGTVDMTTFTNLAALQDAVNKRQVLRADAVKYARDKGWIK